VKDVPTADCISSHHRDNRLRCATDLHLKIENVETADTPAGDVIVANVAIRTTDPLIPAAAERRIALSGQDDHADLIIVSRQIERSLEFEQCLGTECVANLWPVDGDLRDPSIVAGRHLVTDIGELSAGLPDRARDDA
jgi:hypothetical protein